MILAANGPNNVLEGRESDGIIVMEFPSRQAARVWYDTAPACREVRENRLKAQCVAA
jgi:uncharacterized protein (DUF1330 family)